MSENDDSAKDVPSDEAFFARWSRRKRQAAPAKNVDPQPAVPSSEPNADTEPQPALQSPAESEPKSVASRDVTASPKALTEADFDDVDFEALTYGSDYGRFLQAGVPEGIRQRALTKLWHSDSMFTAVDPFQDYAGDYTDAATVPKSGIVKTAYKVGQGFLSDEEAHVWHRLGKPALPTETLAMSVLLPGVRVRAATPQDHAALRAVCTSSNQSDTQPEVRPGIASDLPHLGSFDGLNSALSTGEAIEIALDEETGIAVAFAGTRDATVTALAVHAKRVRKGIGRAMLGRAVAAISARGHATAQTTANCVSQPFYEAQGFIVVVAEQTKPHDGSTTDALLMEKLLTTPADLVIARETPDQPEVRAFFAASEAYASALYPAESNHFADVSLLLQPHVVFLVARSAGRALGCGCIVKALNGTAEIKRMWVSPEARGLKLGQRLLDSLIAAARSDGVTKLQLETGISQPEAIGLYKRAGFVEIPAFGNYAPDPLSLFMELAL